MNLFLWEGHHLLSSPTSTNASAGNLSSKHAARLCARDSRKQRISSLCQRPRVGADNGSAAFVRHMICRPNSPSHQGWCSRAYQQRLKDPNYIAYPIGTPVRSYSIRSLLTSLGHGGHLNRGQKRPGTDFFGPALENTTSFSGRGLGLDSKHH